MCWLLIKIYGIVFIIGISKFVWLIIYIFMGMIVVIVKTHIKHVFSQIIIV